MFRSMAWLELTSDAFSKDVSIESAVCPPKMFLSILSLFEETCVSQPRWPVVKVSSGSADPLDSVFPSDSAPHQTTMMMFLWNFSRLIVFVHSLTDTN